ncbi:MAG: hypothetical protein FGM24_07070 [Candidatus Kapabacteria bacterium]|nr:hypothetical protein [Candidatus Kapabacteria bacterium]
MKNTILLLALLCSVTLSAFAQTVTIDPMPNNTAYDDFAPTATNHGKVIIFSSDLNGKGQRLMSMEQSNGTWSSASKLKGDVNDAVHSGAAALTPDGQSLIFSSYEHDAKGNGRTDLYVAYKRNGKWVDVMPLAATVNSSSYDAQPSISADGRTLYFVSDRPGGQGGTDIYTSTWDGDAWSIAVPVGSINAASNEMSPVIAADGQTLYFASDRFGGAGGFDIYVAKVHNGTATDVRRLKEPINTTANELFYSALPNSDRAMLSRTTAVGDYSNYTVTPNPFPGEPVTLVEGFVRDASSRKLLGAEITVTDLKSGKRVATLRSDDVTGAYFVTLTAGRVYSITATAEDHIFHSERYEVPSGAKGQTLNKDIELSRIEGGVGRLLIFFDLDKSELKSESMPELERVVDLLRKQPSIRVQFEGHSDDQGTDDYNDGLSQRRADAVRTYITSAGIDSSRLKAKGFGKRRPMVKGSSEEARQQNRRVEMKLTD